MVAHKNKPSHDKTYRDKHKDTLSENSKKRYREFTPEQREAKLLASRKSYELNKQSVLIRSRKRHLEKTYGISAEDYLHMMIKQQNRCAICGQYETRYTKTGDIKPLSVDHNHITGEVRGLLCNDCNALVGFAKEDVEVLNNAINYIQSYG